MSNKRKKVKAAARLVREWGRAKKAIIIPLISSMTICGLSLPRIFSAFPEDHIPKGMRRMVKSR